MLLGPCRLPALCLLLCGLLLSGCRDTPAVEDPTPSPGGNDDDSVPVNDDDSGGADDDDSSVSDDDDDDTAPQGIDPLCFPEIWDTMVAGPDYDQFGATPGSHCLGTDHQDIQGVERVVFVSD